MRRLFWLGVGVAVGALVVRQITKAAHAYTPAGLASSARNSAAGLWESVQDFVADVREGMELREAEIHEAFATGANLADLDDFGELASRTSEHSEFDDETDDTRPR